jgi:hypothetical protein
MVNTAWPERQVSPQPIIVEARQKRHFIRGLKHFRLFLSVPPPRDFIFTHYRRAGFENPADREDML